MHPRLLNSALKKQESLYLYNYKTDERYELDPESFDFIRHCTGKNTLKDILIKSNSEEDDAKELINYLSAESCIEDREVKSSPETFQIQEAVDPSLRYLQLHITERCNLECSHCYLGEKEQRDLEIDLIEKALKEFSPNGMKVLLTGGEALLHRSFWKVVELASSYPVRLELLSNGTLITEVVAKRLSKYIHSIQISLDGMKEGHEHLRGKNCFEKTVEGIKNASKVLDVNIATMIHKENTSEFDEMDGFVKSLDVKEWNIDIPSLAGNATPGLIPTSQEAAEIFKKYGFGTGVHEGDMGFSCGSHICTIDVNGGVSKCGFFEDSVGNIRDESLMVLWKRVVEKYTPLVSSIECCSCSEVEVCRGGCRYRAKVSGDFFGKDPFMCSVYLGE
jgi:radical SAM protein with 4Fe4S-binding SPASM domain